MSRFRIFVVLCILAVSNLFAQNELHVVPVIPMSESVTNHYAGIINGELWIWGGYNYASQSHFERGIRKYHPQAYGASVCVPQGTVCIGGGLDTTAISGTLLMKNIDHRIHKTFLNQYDHSGRVNLPSLPVGLRKLAAATDGEYIYALGGETDSIPNRNVYRLAWPDGTEWELLGEIPDNARIQSSAVVQNTPSGKCLFLFGGYEPAADGQSGFVHTDALKMDLNTFQWTRLSWELPETQALPTVGFVAASLNLSSIIFLGGADKDIFTQTLNQQPMDSAYYRHPAEWYNYQSDILVYNTFMDSWTTMQGQPSFARVGATLSPWKNYYYLAGGEEKPGSGVTDISVVQLLYEPSFGWVNWVVVSLFLLGMCFLSIRFYHKGTDVREYFIADTGMPWWAAGISQFVTMFGALACLFVPAFAFVSDWSSLSLFVGILFVSLVLAKKSVPLIRNVKGFSIYSHLQERFGSCVRLFAVLFSLLFAFVRIVLFLFLPAYFIALATDLNTIMCIVLTGIVALLCVLAGGVKGITWGNVAVFSVFVLGLVVMAVFLIAGTEGGVKGYFDVASQNGKFGFIDDSMGFPPVFWILLIGGITNAYSLLMGDQSLARHTLIVRDTKSASRAVLLNGIIAAVVGLLLLIVGTGLFTYFKTNPSEMWFTMKETKSLLPYAMMNQFPVGISGFLVLSLLALSLGSVSQNINAMGLTVVSDLSCSRLPDSENQVLAARIASAIVAVSGIVVASLLVGYSIELLLQILCVSLNVFACTVGASFFFCMGRCRVGSVSAMAGAVFGLVSIFVLLFFTDIHVILQGVIAFFVSLFVAWLVSLFTRR